MDKDKSCFSVALCENAYTELRWCLVSGFCQLTPYFFFFFLQLTVQPNENRCAVILVTGVQGCGNFHTDEV
jgi:hypothetical protein